MSFSTSSYSEALVLLLRIAVRYYKVFSAVCTFPNPHSPNILKNLGLSPSGQATLNRPRSPVTSNTGATHTLPNLVVKELAWNFLKTLGNFSFPTLPTSPVPIANQCNLNTTITSPDSFSRVNPHLSSKSRQIVINPQKAVFHFYHRWVNIKSECSSFEVASLTYKCFLHLNRS